MRDYALSFLVCVHLPSTGDLSIEKSMQLKPVVSTTA